jgi:hypothetical protein
MDRQALHHLTRHLSDSPRSFRGVFVPVNGDHGEADFLGTGTEQLSFTITVDHGFRSCDQGASFSTTSSRFLQVLVLVHGRQERKWQDGKARTYDRSRIGTIIWPLARETNQQQLCFLSLQVFVPINGRRERNRPFRGRDGKAGVFRVQVGRLGLGG